MGRWQEHDTTNDYIRLDVRWLKRERFLQPGYSGTVSWSRRGERFALINISAGDGELRLQYRTRSRGDEWQEKDYSVEVELVPCHFGGHRAWFRCPIAGCGQRVAILYGATLFACRRCLRLTYESQREAPHYRALHKAQTIHEKLGGTGIIDDPVFKPKWMHWRTYYRQLLQFREAEARAVPPWLFKTALR
jgi:hypothetical protein